MSEKDSAFIFGVANPCEETAALINMGFGWVFPPCAPFPYLKTGSVSLTYLDYKARIEKYRKAGLRVFSISPSPRDFIRNGIDLHSREGMSRVSGVCRFLAEDMKDGISAWQIADEISDPIPQLSLSENEAYEFLRASMKGLREGNPSAMLGHGILDDKVQQRLSQRFEPEGKGSDYIILDWKADVSTAGDLNHYLLKARRIYDALHLPVIIMKFGYASAGQTSPDMEADMLAWLRERGIPDFADLEANPARVIPMLPEKMQDMMYMRQTNQEKMEYLRRSASHILHKWPQTGKRPHTEAAQAEFFDCMLAQILQKPYIKGVFVYSWRDHEACFTCGERDCPCETTWGMVRRDGSEKPVANIIRKYAEIIAAGKGEITE